MLPVTSLELDLHHAVESTLRGQLHDKQGIRVGLAIGGASLGAAVGLLAVVSTGIAVDNPIGWLAVGCGAVIGAVLGY